MPDPPVLRRDPMDVIWDANREHGVAVDEDTLRPGWLGEKLDVGYAIAVLHPRALKPAEAVITIGGPPEEPLGVVDASPLGSKLERPRCRSNPSCGGE